MLCCILVISCVSVGVPYAQSCLCPLSPSEMAGIGAGEDITLFPVPKIK